MYLLYISVCVHVYLSRTRVFGLQGGQEKASDSLELDDWL